MADRSDAELLCRFRAGEDGALDSLLHRYESPLYCFLLGILRDPHRAEDALQETFVRALEHLDGVDTEHLRGWLFTVAYHQAMLLKRKQAVRRECNGVERLNDTHAPAMVEGPTDPAPGPSAKAELADEVSRLRLLIEQLPAAQREVIRQRVYEGKKFREIAQSLGCPLNTALARMHEGLKRLRLLWGECNV